MSEAQFMARAADVLRAIVHETKPDQLGAPTPCTERNVRGLVNHLLFWGPSLVGAGRKETVPPPAADESDVDLVTGDWAGALLAQLDQIVSAWGEPGAWTGTTHMGGPMELPSDLVGGMVVGELVVHGWDLARATGQQPEWDEELLAYLRDEVARSVEQGRAMGVYGAEVSVPESAPLLDRTLALTGRDPRWSG